MSLLGHLRLHLWDGRVLLCLAQHYAQSICHPPPVPDAMWILCACMRFTLSTKTVAQFSDAHQNAFLIYTWGLSAYTLLPTIRALSVKETSNAC